MESSRIRINEATVIELKGLTGIGPKRAAYIQIFRNEVGPITNVFDLATAANISIKRAKGLSDQIDWYAHQTRGGVSFWPLIISSIACFCLFSLAYRELLTTPKNIPGLFFLIGNALIMIGALLAASDLVLASTKNKVSETTYLFWFGLILFFSGLLTLATLSAIGLITNLQPNLSFGLKRAMLFVFMGLIVFWVMYGPAIILRWIVGGSSELLFRFKRSYEWSYLPISICAAMILVHSQLIGSLEEIFAVWTVVVLTINGLELRKGESAFAYNLSPRDLERYDFLFRHQITNEANVDGRLGGIICLASATILAGLLIKSLIQL